MNLRYRVLFADDGFEDRNLLKIVELANLRNSNRGLWDYYVTNIKRETLDELGFNQMGFLKCISRVADYNAICNVVDDAKKSLNSNPEILENKINLIYEMSEQFARTYMTENEKLRIPEKKEIKEVLFLP